jgi:hypothetical protein
MYHIIYFSCMTCESIIWWIFHSYLATSQNLRELLHVNDMWGRTLLESWFLTLSFPLSHCGLCVVFGLFPWFLSRFPLILISFLISRSCFDFFFLWVKEYSRCLYFVKLAENFLLNILFHSIQAKFMKVRFFGNYLRVQFGMFLVLLSFIIIMLEYVSEFKI